MESFTIEANKGAIEGITSLSIVVGIGSSSQLLLGDCLISFVISSTDSFLNPVKLGGLLLFSVPMICGWMVLRFSCIFIILAMKNLLNLSDSSSSVCPSGRGRP